MKVAIVGAGNGGLTACADLKERGFEVSLFESDKFCKDLDFIKKEGGLYLCEGEIGSSEDEKGKFIEIDLISDDINEVIKGDTDREQQISYSKKVGDLFRKLEQNFEEGSINIATSHLFVVGGESTDSERPIELGGSLLVQKNDLPQNSQYTALGHLHKPQKASERLHAYYSGSPIQYSKSERV